MNLRKEVSGQVCEEVIELKMN